MIEGWEKPLNMCCRSSCCSCSRYSCCSYCCHLRWKQGKECSQLSPDQIIDTSLRSKLIGLFIETLRHNVYFHLFFFLFCAFLIDVIRFFLFSTSNIPFIPFFNWFNDHHIHSLLLTGIPQKKKKKLCSSSIILLTFQHSYFHN